MKADYLVAQKVGWKVGLSADQMEYCWAEMTVGNLVDEMVAWMVVQTVCQLAANSVVLTVAQRAVPMELKMAVQKAGLLVANLVG